MVLLAKHDPLIPDLSKSGFLRCDIACDVARQTRRFVFTVLDEQHTDEYVPGRYLILEYGDANGRVRKACYSIVGCPTPCQVEIIVRRFPDQGVSDAMFSNLIVGSLVRCIGVGGDITAPRLSGFDSLTFFAGGIGLTLPLALIRELRGWAEQGRLVPRVTLLLCTPTLEATPCLAELMALELTEQWFTLRVHVTRELLYQDKGCVSRGRPTEAVLAALEVPQGVVICGSQAFALQMQKAVMDQYGAVRCFIEAFDSPGSQVPANQAGARAVRLKIPASGMEFDAVPSVNLLQQLESQGQPIRSQCRAGICGACKIKIMKGECRREADFALSANEIDAGYALACCSYPMGEELTICI